MLIGDDLVPTQNRFADKMEMNGSIYTDELLHDIVDFDEWFLRVLVFEEYNLFLNSGSQILPE